MNNEDRTTKWDCIIKVKKELNALKRDVESGDMEERCFKDALDETVWELRKVTSDTETIEAACNLIKGQLVMLADLPGTIAWAEGGDEDSNKNWVKGIMSGLLDVVKDYVLKYEVEYDDDCDDGKGYGELDFLCREVGNNFWVDLATSYLDEDYVGEISMRPTREDFEMARLRWIQGSQRDNPRIKALVDYKVKAEHALASILLMECSDPKINELPRSEKFAITIRDMWERLFKDLHKQLEDLGASL